MLVNHEQLKVWNTNLLYSGEKQLLNNKLVCHFHGSWTDQHFQHTSTETHTQWGRLNGCSAQRRGLKGAPLFSPERSPLMGACVIFCMISCIHWQLINLRTIFATTLMSLMRRTEQKLDYAVSFHVGVYYITTPGSDYMCSLFCIKLY